jgi:menaquinol-cytochrome c reductase iron-sulfur subunit
MKLFNRSEQSMPDTVVSPDRRTFLHTAGLAGLLLSIGGMAFQGIRSLIPNILYEPSKRFKIGPPMQLAEGVSFLEDKRLYVFKEGKSFYAIGGACTHLGCTVKYSKLNQPKQVERGGVKKTEAFEFLCPCHGSKYRADGTNYAGPAPRPLYWFKLEVSPDDGQLIVDMNTEVDQNYRLTV